MAKIFLVRNGCYDRESGKLMLEDERRAGLLGEAIARLIGKRIVYSSPAKHTMQTAAKIGVHLNCPPIEFSALAEDGADPVPITNVIERQVAGERNNVVLVTQLPQIKMLVKRFNDDYCLHGENRIPDDIDTCQAVMIDTENECGKLVSA